MANTHDEIIASGYDQLGADINVELNSPISRGQNPAIDLQGYIDNYLDRSRDVLRNIDGIPEETANELGTLTGQNPKNLLQGEAFYQKALELAHSEFETQNKANNPITRYINSFRNRYSDTFAETQILGQGDINRKVINIMNRIVHITGVTYLTDVPLATRPHTANLDFNVSPCSIPQIPPPPMGPPIYHQIDFIRTPLPEIQRQLQEIGQYGFLSTQQGFREYETQKRLLDILNFKIISGTMLENVQETLYEQNFLSLKWHDPNDPYHMRQELENVVNLKGFGNKETQSLILKWFTESQRSAGDPTLTVRINERRDMAFNYLGKRNIPNIRVEEEQISTNKNKFTEIKTFCESIEDVADSVVQFQTRGHPSINAYVVNLEITKATASDNITRGNVIGGAPYTDVQMKGFKESIANADRELAKCKIALKEQNDFLKKTRSYLDIFNRIFNAPLSAAAAMPGQIALLQAALTTYNAAPDKANLNALANLLRGINLQTLITQINIDNVNPALGPNPWNIISEYNQTQENNFNERKKLADNTSTFSPRDFLFAYERATNYQKGIRDDETLRILAYKSTEMQVLQAERAKFQSALNREFGQQVLNREQNNHRSIIGRSFNSLGRLTSTEYDADELLTALTRYSNRHYRALKDIQIDSSEQEIREAITNNNLKYNDLRIIWETFYNIFIERKIKGVDGTIEISDSAWQPVRNFVDNIQKIYIDLKTEDFTEKWNNGIPNPPPTEGAAPETKPEAKNDIQKYQNIITKQEEEQKAANDDCRANMDKIREYVGDFRKFLTDGLDFNKRIKGLEEKREAKNLTDNDKTFLESLTGLKPEQINFRTLVEKGLMFKEIVDIGGGFLNRQKDNLKKKAINTGGYIKNKTISSAKYTKETTVKLGKKTGNLAWRTTKVPFKAAWWTIKAPFRLIKGVGYTGPRYVVRKILKK